MLYVVIQVGIHRSVASYNASPKGSEHLLARIREQNVDGLSAGRRNHSFNECDEPPRIVSPCSENH